MFYQDVLPYRTFTSFIAAAGWILKHHILDVVVHVSAPRFKATWCVCLNYKTILANMLLAWATYCMNCLALDKGTFRLPYSRLSYCTNLLLENRLSMAKAAR